MCPNVNDTCINKFKGLHTKKTKNRTRKYVRVRWLDT